MDLALDYAFVAVVLVLLIKQQLRDERDSLDVGYASAGYIALSTILHTITAVGGRPFDGCRLMPTLVVLPAVMAGSAWCQRRLVLCFL
jgi:hypothetical protein